jgi:hypothetical protein
MSQNNRHRLRQKNKKSGKLKKGVIGTGIAAIILYLSTLFTGIFGGSFGELLRQSDFIDVPASYVEEVIYEDTVPAMKNNASEITAFEITVKEDEIFYDGAVIEIGDLADIIGDNTDSTVILTDDNAKRVKYSAVLDELGKIGVVIEEK